MSDVQTLLRHIQHCIARIEHDARAGKKTFLANGTIQDAVVHNLQIIGEASKKLPESLKEKHPNVPWKEIAGMRDVIVHDYFGISWEKESIQEMLTEHS
jgi:uncharacterized protein with HEPN domain